MNATPRRDFLRNCFSSSCGFYATLLLAPTLARSSYGQKVFGDVIGKRPFGRIEKVGDDVWALVSTPFTDKGTAGDTSTHSNGGLIVGSEGILAIDSYRTTAGARFVAEACQFLTGRLPTHIVNTHFHFDHLGGTRAFLNRGGDDPEVIMTQTTRKLAFDTYIKTLPQKTGTGISTLGNWGGHLTDASTIITEEANPLELDLGGRTATITPMSGHTGSDLVIEDGKTGVTFGGDLIWDGIFPNFMSSTPSTWRSSVGKILAKKNRVIVPGHGGIQKSDSPELQRYQLLLEAVDEHARAAFEKGDTVEAAAQSFKIPASVGEFQYFRNGFHELAMDAWYRELKS